VAGSSRRQADRQPGQRGSLTVPSRHQRHHGPRCPRHLGALAAKLTDSQAKEAVLPFLVAIKGTTAPDALGTLGVGLGALTAKLDPPSANAAEIVANGALEKTRNKETFVAYAELSTKLALHEPRDHQVTWIFHLLRHPLTAGDPTKTLLTLLERVQGVQIRFGGDLWKAVEWAEKEKKAGRLNGLDLDAPLQVPFTPLQAFLPTSPH
jgi:hypothetical protein